MHGKFSALNQQTTYRAEIDGLRAVAVLGVLLYHASVSAIPGGFVGVDVFFVISGYLITGIINDDCRKGTFSFLGFYGRRARRIFPALIVVLACSLAAGWFILLPIDYEALSRQAVASALFVPNFLFWSEAGYFDRSAISKPLLHLWSLGIEEQFYLLWPMILVGVARKRALSISFLILVTACSFALCVYLTSTNPASAFYLPQSRAWELSLGALIACARPTTAQKLLRSTLSVLGLVVIAATMLLMNSDRPFPGYIAALPTLGTAAVIWAGRDTIAAKALSWKPITYVGLISFPLYLWHWPLLSFGHYLGFHSARSSLALLTLSFLLAALTYELLEKRLRKSEIGNAVPRLSVALASTAAIAIIFAASSGRNYRYQTTEQHVAAIVATMKYDYQTAGRFPTCWDPPTGPLPPECSAPNDPDNAVLVWGDSHAALFYSGVHKAFPSLPVWQATRSGCLLFGDEDWAAETGEDRGDRNDRHHWLGTQRRNCKNINAETVKLIQERHPRTVIIFQAWEHYSEHYSQGWAASSPFGSALRAALTRLRELKVPNLIVLGPSPYWDPILPKVAYTAWEQTGQIPRRAFARPETTEKINGEIKAIAEASGATFISIQDFLCNTDGCLVHVPGKPGDLIAWDYGHLTMEGAAFIASNILNERILRRQP
jgi:peptidoglycan/LPS O-acetylase OafA/YrhL